MNDNMLQNASKLIEGNLTCNGGAPVIWLHGNARREMEKLRLRHADISLRAHSVRTLAEYGCVKSAGAALAYLLFMERAQSVLVSYDEIARMSLRDELDLALEDATGGNLVVFVDQLATALATSPDAAASFLGFGEKLAEWYGDRVRVVLTDDAVRHMDAVLIQGQLFGAALHPHDIQQICDFLCNPTGHITLDAVINHLFQAVFIVYSAIDREKSIVHRDHRIITEKFFTEYSFIDFLSVNHPREQSVQNHALSANSVQAAFPQRLPCLPVAY